MNLKNPDRDKPFPSLKGLAEQYNSSGMTSDEINLKKLKIYLIENFVEPLILRKVENVNFNAYNFTYILTRLNELKYIDPGEVAVYETIVQFVQETVGTYNQNKLMISRLYANKETASQFTLQLPFITLKPAYEIYNSLYGRPEGFSYNKKILEEIKDIIGEKPGMLYKEVEKILNYRFNDTILLLKHKVHKDKDPNFTKIEYFIYDKIFDITMTKNKYNPKIIEIIQKIMKEYPTYNFKGIKNYFYENHRYWTQYFSEKPEKEKTLKDRYDIMFGSPIDKNYRKNYLKLINNIITDYPDFTDEELELEFEFRQPVWGEMLLKNQTINAYLFKESRFINNKVTPPINF
jgi:hypothetical protein